MHRRIRRTLHIFVLLVALSLLGRASATPPRARSSATAEMYKQRAIKAAATRKLHQEVRDKGLRTAAVKPSFLDKHRTNYSIKVPGTPIRDQEKSGRCWAYAWTKTLLSMAAQKGVKADGLSGSFINYHALRALAHGAINKARRTNDRPEFNLEYLSADMVGEGGFSHWASQITKRHGIVPMDKMRSSFDGRESSMLQNQLHRLVAAAHVELGNTPAGATRKRRVIAVKYKQKVDTLLDTMIGAPPRRFSVDGKSYTPQTYRQQYLKLANSDLEFVNLSHDPTRAFNRRYHEAYGAEKFPEGTTYNVSMDVIQKAVKKTLKQGVAVNVAVNVDWDNPHRVANGVDKASKGNGVLSLQAFDYGRLVPKTKLTKRQRMTYGVSMSNHMMAITGHEPKQRGQQARWQIDNSHGTKAFRGGRFDMYDDYFKQYVEEVTVPRGVLPKTLLASIEGKPTIDAIHGMTIAPSKGGEAWTPKRKQALVKALIREDLSIDEAARRYKLPAQRVKSWKDSAQKAMLQSLR